MKTYILTIPILFSLFIFVERADITTNSLDKEITMCHVTTQAFVDLADDPEFLRAHEDPFPNASLLQEGEMITFPVVDGDTANGYLVKAANPSSDYLLVFHEWYGLNTYVKNESNKFAEQFDGMNVLAVDLYDGGVADNAEGARKLMQSVQTERALAIINAAQNFVGKEANIFTVGWCFGGGWSLQASIEMENQAKGAILFYGMPETDPARLSKLKCDVLGVFASQDGWITPEVAMNFKAAMSDLDNELVLRSYEANHGFANPSNPIYNETAAADAYNTMKDFIDNRR